MSLACSMTGFATVHGEARGETRGEDTGSVGFTLTVKSVNHRFLDLQVRVPHRCEALETPLRAKVKERVRRGHVELTLQLEPRVGGGVGWNSELLAGYVAEDRRAAAALGVAAEVDLNAMLQMPGVMTSGAAAASLDVAGLRVAVLPRLEELLDRFRESRELEGGALVTELRLGVERLGEMTEEVLTLRDEIQESRFERVRDRMEELLRGVLVSEERLLTEAALAAERSDVEEEMVRLRTHVERFLDMLVEGGELGKRLDFLLQEMSREANTLLSKTSGLGEGLRLTEIGLAMKMEIERAKEQVQNLE